MGGIQGRLNKQFAITIAISVLISAFNALTLSPALSALLLRPRRASRGLLARFFGAFNRGFDKARSGYVRTSGYLVRKAVIAVLILVGFAVLAGGLGKLLPGSFLPEEDQGYFLLNVQLPDAASLQRTDAVCRKVENVLGQTQGVRYYNTIAGFSLLTCVSASYNAFYFVSLEPWDEREGNGRSAKELIDKLNGTLPRPDPGGERLRLPAARHPRARHLGRVFALAAGSERRLGRVPEPEPAAFLEAARKRPELPNVNSSVPRRGAAGLRRRRSRQGAEAGGRHRRRLPDAAGVSRRHLRQPVQPLRPAVARLSAVGAGAAGGARKHQRILRAQQRRRHGAALRARHGAAHRRARNTHSASTCSAPRRSRAPRLPATARARP